jgi:outer membrane protein OmpA-like peptidoglycan-associated protein
MAAGDAPDVRIDFEPGSDALPPGASDALAGLADAARRQDGTAVLITGFRGGGSDGALDADLARRREGAVRHALEADGVAPERLVMDEPVAASGAAQAHRVELRLR